MRMKRILLVISCFIVLFTLCIPVQAQNVVTVADTDIYLFNPMPNKGQDLHMRNYGSGLSCGPLPIGLVLQQYVPQDTVTVYGVALTMRNYYRNGSFDNIVPTYRAVMLERAAGTTDVIYHHPSNPIVPITIERALQYVDSVTLLPNNIKQCLFRYEVERPAPPHTSDLPCVEFYFNKPRKINRMADTFYVGREFFLGDTTFYPSELIVQYNPTPPTCEWWYLGYWDTTRFSELHEGNGLYYWGFAFPIIGFRCKPIDEENYSLLLSDVSVDGITVRWYCDEEGVSYNVRATSTDGSIDTIAVTDDSVYTFHGLPTNKCYNVHVRKQCRYATVNYDTIVYSPWTTERVSFVLGDTTGTGGGGTGGEGIIVAGGVDFTVSPNPASQRVEVTSPQPMTCIEVVDAMGRVVKSFVQANEGKATLDVSLLPVGAYLLRIHTSAGLSCQKLLVR